MKPSEIAQVAYATRDLDRSVKRYAAMGSAGPFYVGEFALTDMLYRGTSVNYPKLRVAFGYQGDLQIEFIETPEPGSFHAELLGDRQEGVHHTFVSTDDYDKTVAGYAEAGFPVVFQSDENAASRLCFIDTVPFLGHFLEVIDFTTIHPSLLVLYQKIKDASVAWDGRDPVRKLADLF